jgi:chromate transporter
MVAAAHGRRLQLGRAVIVDAPTAILAVASGAVLFQWRVNSTWLVLGGAAKGAVVQWVR